jgi:hypothetical protein
MRQLADRPAGMLACVGIVHLQAASLIEADTPVLPACQLPRSPDGLA